MANSCGSGSGKGAAGGGSSANDITKKAINNFDDLKNNKNLLDLGVGGGLSSNMPSNFVDQIDNAQSLIKNTKAGKDEEYKKLTSDMQELALSQARALQTNAPQLLKAIQNESKLQSQYDQGQAKLAAIRQTTKGLSLDDITHLARMKANNNTKLKLTSEEKQQIVKAHDQAVKTYNEAKNNLPSYQKLYDEGKAKYMSSHPFGNYNATTEGRNQKSSVDWAKSVLNTGMRTAMGEYRSTVLGIVFKNKDAQRDAKWEQWDKAIAKTPLYKKTQAVGDMYTLSNKIREARVHTATVRQDILYEATYKTAQKLWGGKTNEEIRTIGEQNTATWQKKTQKYSK